jgi:hypothetical protein
MNSAALVKAMCMKRCGSRASAMVLAACLAVLHAPVFCANVDELDPFRFQGSLLDPSIRGELDGIIKNGNLKEVQFKDYARADNWSAEILPPHTSEKSVVTPDAADLNRGFIPYSRPVTELVFRSSRPRERKDHFEIAAVRGEYEPFTLCLFNLGMERTFSLSISQFKNVESGDVLAAKNIEVRAPAFLPLIRKEQNIYINLPMALEKKAALTIPAEETGQFWITTYVPPEAQPGTYEAAVKVTADDGRASEFPVVLTVLPFNLDESAMQLSMCFLIQNAGEMYPENLDRYMGDMRTHGLNSIWTWPLGDVHIQREKLSVDFSTRSASSHEGPDYFAHSAEEILSAYKKAGFERDWIYGSCDALLHLLAEKGLAKPEDPASALPYVEQYIRDMLQFARERNLPPFTLLLKDEPGFQPQQLPSVRKLYAGIHRAFPDQPLMVDCGPWAGEDELLAPYIRTIYFTSPDRVKERFCRNDEITFGNYNSGSGGKNPLIDRFCYGVWPLQANLDAVSNWAYTWKMHPNAPDGNRYVFPAADGPIPTLAWEAIREGIDDQRYLLTFRRLAREAMASDDEVKKARAAAMMADVDEFMSSVPKDRSGRATFLENLSQDRLDRLRGALISHILELRGYARAETETPAV